MLKKLFSSCRFQFSNTKFITRRDPYRSLQIFLKQKTSVNQIKQQLTQFQAKQKEAKTNAIWIFLNNINLEHVGLLVNQMGYRIHHGKDNQVALYKWISHKIDLVPSYSNCYVACGAIVIQNDHVLYVEQSNGPRKGLFGIPGGRADIGQFLQTTAERQLLQETGIVSKFQHFIYFRQMQNTVFGAKDIYFACLMKAQEQSLKKLKLCDRQLASHEWVHLSKVGQFVNKKSVGTQKQLGNYITQLYNKGFNFQVNNKEQYPNISNINIFSQAMDGIHRKFTQYKLINLKNN